MIQYEIMGSSLVSTRIRHFLILCIVETPTYKRTVEVASIDTLPETTPETLFAKRQAMDFDKGE